MKRYIALFAVLALLTLSMSCATPQGKGAAVGAGVGGAAGAMLDHNNPWRGGVIGAGAG